MHNVLATDSELVFVWHDNSGQRTPDNSAYLQSMVNSSGFNIEIKENATLEQPIILISSAANQNSLRNIIKLGKNSKAQVVEYLMSDDNNAQNTTLTDIHCADGAQLQHCILHHAKDAASITQQSITNIHQSANSTVNSNVFAFGGTSCKIELGFALEGENAKCEAAYLAYTHNNENQNVLLKIDHLVPHCTSKTVARGILHDKSLTDFIGRIVVHPHASKSFADLQIKNILCSAQAQSNNKPELEIYNDDVHCSHGSSTGQMSEEALFYMRSRGLSAEQAVAMIIAGFIQPTIESCKIPAITDFVQAVIRSRQ